MSVTTFNEWLNSDIYSFSLFTSGFFMNVTNTENFLFGMRYCILGKEICSGQKVRFFFWKKLSYALIGLAHYSNQRDISQEAGCVHNAPHFFRNSFYWLWWAGCWTGCSIKGIQSVFKLRIYVKSNVTWHLSKCPTRQLVEILFCCTNHL